MAKIGKFMLIANFHHLIDLIYLVQNLAFVYLKLKFEGKTI